MNVSGDAALNYSVALSFLEDALSKHWHTTDWIDRPLRWRFFDLTGLESPDHGWKIHVSACAAESAELLRAVAGLLAQLRIPFKVLRHVEDIVLLNSGDAGAEQLGKVLTLYAPNAERARKAINALDVAWPHSRGPEVITDWQVRVGSAVSFRYGVFRATDEVIDSVGVHRFGWRGADGSMVADARTSVLEADTDKSTLPIYGVAPEASHVVVNHPLRIAGAEYIPLVCLGQTPRTATWLGVQIQALQTVVIKAGRRGAAGDTMGIDLSDLMRNEFAVLRLLQDRPGLAPAPLAFVDKPQPLLVMDDFRGKVVSELPRAERIAALYLLAEAVAQVHEANLVHGDVKLENAIRYVSGIGLIDFELATPVGALMRPGGTPGYLDPGIQGRILPAATARDVFALGSCVVQAFLDTPPGLLTAGRAVSLLRNEGLHEAARCVQRWQSSDASLRPTAAAVGQVLRKCTSDWQAADPPHLPTSANRLKRWCRRAALEAAYASITVMQPRAAGACWRNEHFMRAHDCEGINLGAAGVILGLLAIAHSCARTDFDTAVAAGATWLASRSADGKAAGPFTGNAGVALALAVSGQRLSNEHLVRSSRMRFEAAARDRREVDLFSGIAGVIWAAVLLRDLLREDWPLDLVADAFKYLRARESQVDGIPVWTVAPESGTVFFGCAHGSAGIALAYAVWGLAVNDTAAVERACETWSAIARCARTGDGEALRIGSTDPRHHAVGNWCHGVAGYLWAVLNGVGDHPALRAEIDWAVHTLVRAPVAGTPTFCHGLAGHLELWQMLQALPRFSTLAHSHTQKVARALRCLHIKVDGRCVWASDDPAIVTPDLWIGFLGPASALARYAAGAHEALLSPLGITRIASPRELTPATRQATPPRRRSMLLAGACDAEASVGL